MFWACLSFGHHIVDEPTDPLLERADGLAHPVYLIAFAPWHRLLELGHEYAQPRELCGELLGESLGGLGHGLLFARRRHFAAWIELFVGFADDAVVLGPT